MIVSTKRTETVTGLEESVNARYDLGTAEQILKQATLCAGSSVSRPTLLTLSPMFQSLRRYCDPARLDAAIAFAAATTEGTPSATIHVDLEDGVQASTFKDVVGDLSAGMLSFAELLERSAATREHMSRWLTRATFRKSLFKGNDKDGESQGSGIRKPLSHHAFLQMVVLDRVVHSMSKGGDGNVEPKRTILLEWETLDDKAARVLLPSTCWRSVIVDFIGGCRTMEQEEMANDPRKGRQ